MRLFYKEGVRIRGTCPEIVEGTMVVASVMNEAGYDCTITSGVEGSHSETSLHYDGRARDFRSKHILTPLAMEYQVRERLAPLGDFDFVVEDFGEDNEHFHLEWQPKGSKGHL